jgi:hypothetical protein
MILYRRNVGRPRIVDPTLWARQSETNGKAGIVTSPLVAIETECAGGATGRATRNSTNRTEGTGRD